MSDQLLPTHQLAPYGENQLQAWDDAPSTLSAPAVPRSPIERPLAAIRRYKWLMLAIIVLATGGGVAATKFVTPQFEVQARILITSDNPMESRTGPIRGSGLMEADDWSALLKSATIAEA